MSTVLDLNDSELINPVCLPDQQLVKICLRRWDEKEIIINFKEAIAFCFLGFNDPKCMQVLNKNSEFLKNALKLEFDTHSENHGFQCFEFLNYDDVAFIKIIAKEYELKLE